MFFFLLILVIKWCHEWRDNLSKCCFSVKLKTYTVYSKPHCRKSGKNEGDTIIYSDTHAIIFNCRVVLLLKMSRTWVYISTQQCMKNENDFLKVVFAMSEYPISKTVIWKSPYRWLIVLISKWHKHHLHGKSGCWFIDRAHRVNCGAQLQSVFREISKTHCRKSTPTINKQTNIFILFTFIYQCFQTHRLHCASKIALFFKIQ